jgi:DNA-binding MarR family transcriptional regulator
VNDTAPDLLFLLHDVARLMRVRADKRARARGMTRAQWVILIRLERSPGLSQKELAELLEVEPITVARLVDRLALRGLVERRPDPRDRRIWRLHLLDAAGTVLREIASYREELLSHATEGIAPAALDAAMEALLQMKVNLCQDRHANRRGETRRVA